MVPVFMVQRWWYIGDVLFKMLKMEYIISQDSAPAGDLYEDETYCTRGLCAHPCCWESHIRQTRGFKKYVSDSLTGSSLDGRLRTAEYSSDEGMVALFNNTY